MFIYSYCYVCYVLSTVSLCCSVYCLCINVYCTTVNPTAVNKYIICEENRVLRKPHKPKKLVNETGR